MIMNNAWVDFLSDIDELCGVAWKPELEFTKLRAKTKEQ